jgi:hypothetical protein
VLQNTVLIIRLKYATNDIRIISVGKDSGIRQFRRKVLLRPENGRREGRCVNLTVGRVGRSTGSKEGKFFPLGIRSFGQGSVLPGMSRMASETMNEDDTARF